MTPNKKPLGKLALPDHRSGVLMARKLTTWIWALVGSSLVTMPATAAEDGGTRSVFAKGAGSRALSLGGAYAALADDASSAVWNPAGLSYMSRGEFQATHGGIQAIDLSEQYAAVAYPTSRWGTVSFVFRRFNVGGIEQRDDRNLLIADGLSDSESEFTLSYARSLGTAASWGASVKLQRQSLAGFSDAGIGMDLGFRVHPGEFLGRTNSWLNRLTLGISMRNLVEPALRLDSESVPDPTAFRGGLAYELKMPVFGNVVAAMDLEKAKTENLNLHGGLEVSPHPLLALRAGWNDGSFTSGTGIQARGASFDYLYETSDVETNHNFGLSWAFGSTVEERRLAAAQAEEEAFRARLAESFERRQQEQVAELVSNAKSLARQKQYADAFETLLAAETLRPDDAEILRLKSDYLMAQARERETADELTEALVLYGRVLAIDSNHVEAKVGSRRVRSESDRRAARNTQLRGLFAEALDAFTAREFAKAKSKLTAILATEPNDEEARDMLTRTETAIRVRTTTLVSQAERFLERELLNETADLMEEIRALDPNSSSLSALSRKYKNAERAIAARERLAREKATQTKPETVAQGRDDRIAPKQVAVVTPKAPVLSQKKKKEIEDLYRRGIDAMEEERADDALRYWELVWSADPGYLNVASFLKEEYLLRGLETFSGGRLEDAVTLWEKALKVDPTDQRTKGYLARAREQLARTREILGGRS